MGVRNRFRDERFVFDLEKGSWVLNTNGAANDLGYSSSVATDYSYAREEEGFRDRREERSLARNWLYDKCTTLLEGSTAGVRRRRLRGLHWTRHGAGMHGAAPVPVPWLAFPRYPPTPPRDLATTQETVRALPPSCAGCRFRAACATWLGVSVERPGIRLCACAKAGGTPMTRPWEEVA